MPLYPIIINEVKSIVTKQLFVEVIGVLEFPSLNKGIEFSPLIKFSCFIINLPIL